MNLACLILAAGQGTRMKSSLSKVMHPIAGVPLVRHVVSACETLPADKIVIVVAPDMKNVQEAVLPYPCAVQTQPLGTGDAVKAARGLLEDHQGLVLVLFGDTPLITPETLRSIIEKQKETGAALVVGGFVPDDALSYGRLVIGANGQLLSIVEAAEATPEQRGIKLCNGGVMLFEADKLWPLLDKVQNNNSKNEYYLTDCVALANQAGLKVVVTEMPVDDVAGVNTREQLASLEKIMQSRLRRKHMLAGVSMVDPDTVYLSVDTKLGQDVTIGPNVVFGQGVVIGDNVDIRAFCHLEQVIVDVGAVIGPFARLRPGAKIGAGAHIGNFVEVKNSSIGTSAKINHLSYIGDATIGAKTNIGAGTITCNYDGFTKSRTEIGAGAFVGSNTALVAPVTVGDGAVIAAGSTITVDVPSDALAVAREQQSNKEGWAKHFRALQEQVNKVGRA